MNSSFTNVALYIKRAEEYQTKEYIIKVFAERNIGKVHDVKFIKKNNTNTSRTSYENYHGVIVIFERWYMNTLVQQLFRDMSSSPDGTTKFYFNAHRYWIINIHRQKLPECQENTLVDLSLSETEKIKRLEEMVKSMSSHIFYMENKQEKSERLMMELENKETYHNLVNIEIRLQLEEKDLEKQRIEDIYRIELEKLREENNLLHNSVKEKELEIKKLKFHMKYFMK